MTSQPNPELERYQQSVMAKLDLLLPIFAKAAIGDFSQNVPRPHQQGELTELFVGVQLMLGVIRSKITENTNAIRHLRAANRALEQEKAIDEAILGGIGDGLVMIDKTGRVTFINEPAAVLLGCPREQALGQSYFELAPLQDQAGHRRPTTEQPAAMALTTGRKVDCGMAAQLYLVPVPGGSVHTKSPRKSAKSSPPSPSSVSPVAVAIAAAPVIFGRRTVGAVCLLRDISQEVNLDRAKTEIISIASHQLRTPLTTVKWYAEAALDLAKHELHPDLRRYLLTIHAANRRMIEQIDVLLHVSRIEMGSLKVHPKPTDITAVAETLARDLAAMLEHKAIRFTLTSAEHLPRLQTDPELIRVVLQNLISNALHYTPEPGSVNIRIATQGQDLVISVADTGCGIPRPAQRKIFTKLFRADNARALVTDGSGLGLYVAKAIVEKLQGRIWFESEEDHGSTFYVALPLALAHDSVKPPKPKPPLATIRRSL
ncbi:MAG TPA: ATP-binding protein [Candidatus Saccharimonadia bacterium]|nr:ATP-binding protein [Candidatus Saccharimonadia bacterium]